MIITAELTVSGELFEELVFALIHDKPSEFKLKICGGNQDGESQDSNIIGFTGRETIVKDFAGETNSPFTLSKEEIAAEKLVIHNPNLKNYPDVDGMLEFKDDEKKYLVFFQTTLQTPQGHTNKPERKAFFENKDNQYTALDEFPNSSSKLNKHDKVQSIRLYQEFDNSKESEFNHSSYLESFNNKNFTDFLRDNFKFTSQLENERKQDNGGRFKDKEDKEFYESLPDLEKVKTLSSHQKKILEYKLEKRLEQLKDTIDLSDYNTYFVWVVHHNDRKAPPYHNENGKLMGLGLKQSVMSINKIHDDLRYYFKKDKNT